MLKDYLNRMKQNRSDHPISQADFETWRGNEITKQLFEDLEYLKINTSECISAIDSNIAGLQAAKLNGVQDTVDYANAWVPDCLDDVL